ncbi:MAG TPA: hypothetical protein PLP61_10250 [Nocardioides sp.]|uniref:hypothetical protein n=1 Tax=Nocardioides sp. TaxID=35761 RepID=UPI002C1D6C77|nr:hypothetical protein [Nocardioides sp.]HQR27407.1 hypothetical protein [Nocardioides sp.]
MPDADVPEAAPVRLDRETRRVVAISVAASSIGWWPAFTLGVYGVIFFEQHLALWAAATSAFIAVEVSGGRRVLRRVSNYTLLLPSLWLVLIWLLPVTDSTARYLLFWFGVLVTLLGMPALAAFLVRLLIPGAENLPRRQAAIAIVAVAIVMAAAYLLGTQHPHMLSCDDFTISGNFAPANCNPGIATTESGTP